MAYVTTDVYENMHGFEFGTKKIIRENANKVDKDTFLLFGNVIDIKKVSYR